MTELAPVLSQCHVCRSPIADAINAKIAAGVVMQRISDFTRDAGHYASRKSLFNHKKEHLATPHTVAVNEAKRSLAKQARTIKAHSGDLAPLIRNLVYTKVEAGDLSPTIAEGLRAQETIDRRLERGADRDLMLVMAQVLGGGATPAVVIEGQWTQLDAERLEDEASFRQLGLGVEAADALRATETYRPAR